MSTTPSKMPRRTPICHRMIGHQTTYDWQGVECCGSACSMWAQFAYPVFRVDGADEHVISPGTGRCADNRDAEPWNDPAFASATDTAQDEE